MLPELDKIDRQLLSICNEAVGNKTPIDIIKAFLDCHTWDIPEPSAHTLRDRINRLGQLGLVELDRKSLRGRVLCEITKPGKEALSGWKENHLTERDDLP